jgi:hypothetical protein
MREIIVSRAREAGRSLGRAYASDVAFKGAVPVAVVLLMLLVTLWLSQALDAFAASRATPVVPESLPGTRRTWAGTHQPLMPKVLARSSAQLDVPRELNPNAEPPVSETTPGPVARESGPPAGARSSHLPGSIE